MSEIRSVLGVRTKDMLSIFEDEGRENGRISPYPAGTGRIWPRIVVGNGLWWSAPRRPRLLALDKSRSRQDHNLTANRTHR